MKEHPTPQWLIKMYQEIDDKVEVTSFLHLSDDAEMHFGSGIWKGREQIREKFPLDL